MKPQVTPSPRPTPTFDVVVVGAGVSGLAMIHGALKKGWRVQCFEAGSGVGGTWFWNRYPGCRVDIEAYEYSYAFSKELQNEWVWSERYPAQAELERYLNHVADRFGLREHIEFRTRVTSASFDETHRLWKVETDAGATIWVTYLVMATGVYSDPYRPMFEGLDAFEGRQLQTSRWPAEPQDFNGQHVGIIGTGASSVQITPILATQAERLTVFQRTASYTVPLRNHPIDASYSKELKSRYAELREAQRRSRGGYVTVHNRPAPPPTRSALEVSDDERQRVYEERWTSGGLSIYHAFTDLLTNEHANRTLEAFYKDKIRGRVCDPAVAERMMPRFDPVLTKRLAGDTGYCEAFNRPNVELVDLRSEPIRRFTRGGLQVGEREIPLDVIIFATGFDLGTGAMSRIEIRGRGGRSLKDHWNAGVRSYLGMMANGFPNLFWVFGPGCPVYNPMLLAPFQVDLIEKMVDGRDRAEEVIEASAEAEARWTTLSNSICEMTLFSRGSNYYIGGNIPGKPRVPTVFFGGFPLYAEHCAKALATRSEFITLAAAS